MYTYTYMHMLFQIDSIIRPGLISLTWTSINLESFFARTKASIDELEVFVNKMTDLKVYRIDKIFENISTTIVFNNDEMERLTIPKFMQLSENWSKLIGTELGGKSFKIEEALRELVVVTNNRALEMLKQCKDMAERSKVLGILNTSSSPNSFSVL